MNSLLDPEITRALYEASCAGVEVDLIVRGICCLIPGIPGVSENIRVRSIVGWLLEHSRIYYFYNDGNEEFYLSSADWMPRNLDRRIELLFPVEEKRHMKRLHETLEMLLSDNRKSRMMKSDGSYIKVAARGSNIVNSQESFYEMAQNEVKNLVSLKDKGGFQPIIRKNEL